MIPILETSLEYRDRCPKCDTDWQALEGMLYEPIYSDNRQVALAIIKNCDVCQVKFRKFMEVK